VIANAPSELLLSSRPPGLLTGGRVTGLVPRRTVSVADRACLQSIHVAALRPSTESMTLPFPLESSQTVGLVQRQRRYRAPAARPIRHRRASTRTGWVAHDFADCSARSRSYGRTAVLSYVDGCAAYLSSPDGAPAFIHEAVSPARGALVEDEQLGQRTITDLVEP
jgi:hypothetical protein